MSKPIQLQIGELIQLRNGTASKLILIQESPNEIGHPRKVEVRCHCGEVFTTLLDSIRSGKTSQCKACGFKASGKASQKDLTGIIFNRLTVQKIDGRYRNKILTYTCLCSCGNIITNIPGGSLTSGNTTSCGCYHKEVISQKGRCGSNWEPGDVIGQFTILERLPDAKNGNYRYRAYNHLTNRENCLPQGTIQLLSTPVGRLKHRLHVRYNDALRQKGLRKTRSCIKGLPWSVQDIFDHIGPRPDKTYHLEHICPLDQATTEAEVIVLNNPVNLRWLPAKENMSKNARWTPEGNLLCLELLGRPWQ